MMYKIVVKYFGDLHCIIDTNRKATVGRPFIYKDCAHGWKYISKYNPNIDFMLFSRRLVLFSFYDSTNQAND